MSKIRKGYTPKQTRRLGGEPFTFHGSYAHRMDAEAVKEELQERGFKVRIVRNKHPVLSGEQMFVIYKRRR